MSAGPNIGLRAVALALAWILVAPAAAEEDPVEARHVAAASAFAKRSAEAVVALIDPAPGATLTLRLLDPPVARQAYSPSQARRTLAEYFGKIRSASLADVTPSEAKRDAPAVRLYDYERRREGRDAETTRLEVTLLRGADGRWHLASVIERTRPRRP